MTWGQWFHAVVTTGVVLVWLVGLWSAMGWLHVIKQDKGE